MKKLYKVDFYNLVIGADFKTKWLQLHSVFVEKESEAKFLCEAFKGSMTKAEYIEVQI